MPLTLPLILFITLPLLEIYFFILIGGVIGAFTTILLILLTAFIGVVMLRYQGTRTLTKLRADLQRGQPPALAVWHTILLAIAGILLLTPGFLTDSLGGLLLVPSLRVWLLHSIIKHWLQRRFAHKVSIIEGEYIIHK